MPGGNWFPHKPFRWSGVSGMEGSGWSGFSGQGGAAEHSGYSGYSGATPPYNFTFQCIETLDETRIGTTDYSPPPSPIPESSELVLTLKAGEKYILTGNIIVDMPNDPSGGNTVQVWTRWKYTGTMDSFKVSYLGTGAVLTGATGGTWLDVNTTYGPDTGFFFFGGGLKSMNTNVNNTINGTIETTTAGVLSFCWVPYVSVPGTETLNAARTSRGSYLNALSFGSGAASGMSGYSGRDGLLTVGTWVGV